MNSHDTALKKLHKKYMTIDSSRKKVLLHCDVRSNPHHESLKQLIFCFKQSHCQHQVEMGCWVEKLITELCSIIQQHDKTHRENFQKVMKNLELLERMTRDSAQLFKIGNMFNIIQIYFLNLLFIFTLVDYKFI